MFNVEQIKQIKKVLANPKTEAEKILNKPIEEVITRGYEIFVAVVGNEQTTHGRTCFMSESNFVALISLQIYRMIQSGAFSEEEVFGAIKKSINFYKAQDAKSKFPEEWIN